MPNKSMTPKSSGYGCGGKVHKKNKGGKVKNKKSKYLKGGSMKLSKTSPPLGNNPQAGQENRKPPKRKPPEPREPITKVELKKRRLGYSGYNKGGATCCSNLADKAEMYRQRRK
jgi:hypothetical protein